MPTKEFSGYDLGASGFPLGDTIVVSAFSPATRNLSDSQDDPTDDDLLVGETLDLTDLIDGDAIISVVAATLDLNYTPGIGELAQNVQLDGTIVAGLGEAGGANLFFIPDDLSAVPGEFIDGSAQMSNATADMGAARTISLQEDAPTCFRNGTKILTPRGEVNVESIRPGDLVTLTTGAAARVKWVTRRDISRLDQLIAPETRLVRIPKHAFGNHMPNRDLYVSQFHRFEISQTTLGKKAGLRPNWAMAQHLLGVRETQIEARYDDFTYHHILLDQQALLIANGVPTESLSLNTHSRRSLGVQKYQEIRGVLGERRADAYQNLPFMDIPQFYLAKVLNVETALEKQAV